MSGWDKSGTGDSNPDQQRGPRVNWNPFTDGPMPEWAKPGYVDNRPLVPPPDPSKTLTMEELSARLKAEYAAKDTDEADEETDAEPGADDESESTGEQAKVQDGEGTAAVGGSGDPPDDGGDRTVDAKAGQIDQADAQADDQPDRETEGTDKTPDAAKIGRLESTIKRFEGLFHRQDDVIDSQQKQIDTLNSHIDRQDKTIEKLEAKNDTLEARNDGLQNENNRLRSELAKKSDQPGEGQSAVATSPKTVSEEVQAGDRTEPDTPWYKKFPSEKLVGIGTTVAGLGQAIAAGTHHMSSAESGIITAGIGVGVSVLGYAREKYTERKARNADRPEN